MGLHEKTRKQHRLLPIRKYGVTAAEFDTYESLARSEKEQKISLAAVRRHWNIRARRQGLQTVMSARHTLRQNEIATRQYNASVIKFIRPYMTDKKVFELGVGVGRITHEIAQYAQQVVGNDFSPLMIRKARAYLKNDHNVSLFDQTISDLKLARKSFDLVFASIVLLHILNQEQLLKTIAAMQRLSHTICIIETANNPSVPHSKYTIMRPPQEYIQLFKPFSLVKKKYISCAGDTLIMMLFQLK